MKIQVLNYGYLKVQAREMIIGIDLDRIRSVYPVDKDGFMRIAMNSLLVEHNGRVVLIDPGCGDFLPGKIRDDYGLEVPVLPEQLLRQAGYEEKDITDVIFTHLHFDHGTAAFKRIPGRIIRRYENARYHISKAHYTYALKPAAAEKNSFFTFVFRYLDQINWLEEWDSDWLRLDYYEGHTKGMAVPRIEGKDVTLVFASDLIPLRALMEAGTTSRYDLNPALLMREKENFLQEERDPTIMVLYHETADPYVLLNGGGMTTGEALAAFNQNS